MRQYDTTFIIDGTLDVADREAIIEKLEKSLKKLGGKIDRIVRWGQRKLAYEINKCKNGYYTIFYYNAEPSIIKSFENELRINEKILRYMTLLFDGKHPDYIRDEVQSSTISKLPQETEDVSEETKEISEDIATASEIETAGDNTLNVEGEEEPGEDEILTDSDAGAEMNESKDDEGN